MASWSDWLILSNNLWGIIELLLIIDLNRYYYVSKETADKQYNNHNDTMQTSKITNSPLSSAEINLSVQIDFQYATFYYATEIPFRRLYAFYTHTNHNGPFLFIIVINRVTNFLATLHYPDRTKPLIRLQHRRECTQMGLVVVGHKRRERVTAICANILFATINKLVIRSGYLPSYLPFPSTKASARRGIYGRG